MPMRIKLDITKSLEENAAILFETAKKARRKSIGAKDAASRLSAAPVKPKEKRQKVPSPDKKTYWYMQYRWFYTARGNLAIGGRDATSNEEIIKKRMEQFDIVFHAEIPGSPFFILKGFRGVSFSDDEKQAIANATASYSRAWKYGVSFIDVFCVSPGQVSKKARAGEYVSKGSFMIHGSKDFFQGELRIFGAIKKIDSDAYIMFTPQKADDSFVEITSGNEKPSDAAKKIIAHLSSKGYDFGADEIIAGLPPGNLSLRFIENQGAKK
jgi:hypothetical protein